MNQKTIWFVIVTYKPDKEVLRRLVAAIHEWPTEILDNTDRNLGFGGGANVGMKKAFDAGAAWAIVCNQDIELMRGGVLKFTKELEHCDPGIVGPEAGELDAKRWTTILASSASRPGLEARGWDFHASRGNENLTYISGSLMAIHRDVWEATGGFFEPYFMYYEDADLSVRAKRAGFALRTIEIKGFRHGSVKNDNKEKTKEYYLARNHLLFVRRLAPLSVKLHEFLRMPKTLTEHYQGGNIEAIMGIRDFALERFASLKAGP